MARLRRLSIKGSPRELGRQYGQAFATDIRRNVLAIDPDQILAERGRLIRHALALTEKYFPQYIEEIRGIAEGAEMTFLNVFVYNCPEIRGQFRGCSSIAVKNNTDLALAHNEDGDQAHSLNDIALIEFKTDQANVTALTYLGELPGNAFGWNNHGLFFTINDLLPAKIKLNQVPRHFVARAVSECQSVGEAVRLLESAYDASGFHYFIGSTVDKQIVSVETAIDNVNVVPVSELAFHTNHYIHANFKTRKSHSGKSSRLRLKRLKQLLKPPVEIKNLKRILGDRKNAPWCIYPGDNDANRTLAAVIINLNPPQVKVYAGGVKNQKPLKLPLFY